MKIKLICVGQKMPTWVQTGFNEFAKRMQSTTPTSLIEVPVAKRGKTDSAAEIHKYCQQEGQGILSHITQRDFLIALEVKGKMISTERLASQIQGWMQDGIDLAFVIGGPDGLSDDVRARANWQWSLSDLTLPHPIARLLVIEQIYRAYSIIKGHPYHRE